MADFRRTGFSDIVSVSYGTLGARLRISHGGKGDFEDFTFIPASTPFAAVGRFDETKMNERKGADILVWDRLKLKILLSGTGAAQPHSRQDMR